MSKRKFIKGAPITSLDELNRVDFAIVNGKTYHVGWIRAWSMNMAYNYIRRGDIFHADRLTNGEYYNKLPARKQIQRHRQLRCPECGLGADQIDDGVCCKCFFDWLKEPVA